MQNNKELDRYYWRIRTASALKRLRKKRNKKKSKLTDKRFLLSREIHLNYFAQTAFHPVEPKTNKKKLSLNLSIPKKFSIYDKPEQVLKIISSVARAQRLKRIKSIHIDHKKCKDHDLGAEILLASSVSCLNKVKSSSGMKFHVSGDYPQDQTMSRMLNSIGVVKEVNARDNRVEKDESDKTLVFRNESIPKEVIDSSGGDKKNQTCSSFIQYFDKCLNKAGKKLSQLGKQKLIEYTGEILDNATRHSGTNMWHIYMYMDYTNDNTLNVHIVVYSLGYTIYEKFSEKKSIEPVWAQFSNYLNTHKGKFTEEDLVTVMSMQQTVTSNKEQDNSGGLGTVNFIKFFDNVARECDLNAENTALMTIISGRTQLKFDGSIKMRENEKGLQVMPFNISGDLSQPPERKYVKNLGDSLFPGVLIGIKFPIKNGSELTV